MAWRKRCEWISTEWMTMNKEITRCLLGKMFEQWAFWMQPGKLWVWRSQFDRVIKLLSRRDSHPLCLTTIMHTHSSSTGHRHGLDDDQVRVNKSMWIDLQLIWTRLEKSWNQELMCTRLAPNWEWEQTSHTLNTLDNRDSRNSNSWSLNFWGTLRIQV